MCSIREGRRRPASRGTSQKMQYLEHGLESGVDLIMINIGTLIAHIFFCRKFRIGQGQKISSDSQDLFCVSDSLRLTSPLVTS